MEIAILNIAIILASANETKAAAAKAFRGEFVEPQRTVDIMMGISQ
jgi:hypothetical protein